MIPDTKGFPEGGLLCALYEPLDPSLIPSSSNVSAYYDQPLLAIPSHSNGLPIPSYSDGLPIASHSNGLPVGGAIAHPEHNMLSQPVPLEPHAPNLESPKMPESAKVSEEGSGIILWGQKRKGDDPVAKPEKKTKGAENVKVVKELHQNVTGKEDGTAKGGEVKERAGKPTLSGHVPLMPTHLAEAGYQGEKKGKRGWKPGPKGAAKIATKKKE